MSICHICGEEYSDELSFCPKCGARNLAQREPEEVKPLNVMAIVGMALAASVPLAGLIVSIIALKKAKTEEFRKPLYGLAKAGVIVGAIGTVYVLVMLIVYIVMIAKGLPVSGYTFYFGL